MLFFGSVAAVVVLIARRGTRTSWPTLAWLGVFAAIGAYAIRGVAWWPLAPCRHRRHAPDGARARPERAARTRRSSGASTWSWPGRSSSRVALLPVWRPVDPDLQAPAGVVGNAPPGITAVLREIAGPGDRVFNPQTWGSWFEFALPDAPGRHRLADRALPGRGLGRLRRRHRGARRLGGPADELGRDDRRRRRRTRTRSPTGSRAGWARLYDDADGVSGAEPVAPGLTRPPEQGGRSGPRQAGPAVSAAYRPLAGEGGPEWPSSRPPLLRWCRRHARDRLDRARPGRGAARPLARSAVAAALSHDVNSARLRSRSRRPAGE